MEKVEDICLIHQLPYEVLCKIFDFLDINSVKQCSRTCRRWQETIFSDNYIKRFKMRMRLPLPLCEGRQALKQSDRLYCNVDLEIHRYTESIDGSDLFNEIYTIFCYPKLEQLVTLKVTIPIAQSNITRMISDAIKHMAVLRELHINTSTNWLASQIQMVGFHIRSHSIQLLVAQAIMPIVVSAPKLSSMRVVVFSEQTVPVLNEKLLYSCRLPNLKHLEIDKSSSGCFVSKSNVNHVIRFFGHLKSLETLKLKHLRTCGYLFKAICESCTNLTELFIESLHILENSTLRNLSNLANLQHLTFKNIKCLEPVAFRAVNLPKLESLAIGHFPILYETLTAFKFATKITLLGLINPSDWITAIATKMPNLKHVELKHYSSSVVQLLNVFAVVEVLTVRFPISCFANSNCIMANIKEINSLSTTEPTALEIERLRTRFPKLQLLKVGTKFKYTFSN